MMPPKPHPLYSAVAQEPRLAVWLTHLWQRRSDHGKLGLVLGAGVSHNAGVPLWEELVKRLAKASNVSDHRMTLHKRARLPETFLAQILYRQHCNDDNSGPHPSERFRSYYTNATWKEKIRACLYRDVGRQQLSDISDKHRYLMSLARLVCNARFAITFNFDDIVDEAVIECARIAKIPRPEIIFRPKIETRHNAPVIYHINGALPRDRLRRGSEHVILTEDAFADILLSPNSYDAEFAINHFSTRTFVLLGTSLSDNSLKNLLRSSAKRNPANHHFIIFHERDGRPRSAAQRADIFNVNLDVYNLISIFLTTREIKAFLDMINEDNGDTFDRSLSALISTKIDRKYYLVGAVAAGKTSALDNLRCFTTFEEFSGRVPAVMYRDDRTLTPRQQKQVDDYLFPQLIEKNSNMIRMNSGIRITDRAYLDLFAFSQNREREINRKAAELKKRFKDWGRPMENGHIFFLQASEQTTKERMARRGIKRKARGDKIFEINTLLKQGKDLSRIYGPKVDAIVNTSTLDVGETAKHIARTILLDAYQPFDFSARLNEIIKRRGKL